MEGITENMAHVLSLTEKEVVVHEHLDDVGGDVQIGKTFCLVFRVFTTRTIKIEWFEEATRNAWITRAPITFSKYGNGMFMVEFGCEGDMRRVIKGQPWNFDHCLVTSANPAGLDTLLPNQLRYSPFWIQVHSIPFGMKSYKLAKMIGDEVGDFLEVDKITILKVSGLFLHVRVLLDVSKPILRGILVDFRNIHKEKWLNFKYENLPNIYFHCAPVKSNFKRNLFDLSNSFPLEELPLSHGQVDQSLTAAVSQFLTTQDVGAGSSSSRAAFRRDEAISHGFIANSPISSPKLSAFERTISTPAFNSGLSCDIPVGVCCDATQVASPTTATAVHTTADISPENVQSIARTTEKSKGKAIVGAKRSAFIPHSVMVGDSLRNILKRARASPIINDASTAADSSFEQAGSSRAFRNLSLVVNNHKPSFLFVMESKLLAGHCDIFRTKLSFDNAFEVPRNGLGGGLLLFWKKDVNVTILNYSSNHIDCIVTFEDNITNHISCYYGSPYVHDKLHTWVLLDRLFDNAPQLPWLVLGDFNDYLSINDRSSSSSLPHYAMVNFQAFVNKYSLAPVHFVGNKFTWKYGSTYERLDWGIANDKWFHHYPQAILHHLNFYGSDHRVLKLVLSDDSMHKVKNKSTISNQAAIETEICRFFSTLFHSQGSSRDATNLLLSAINSRLTAHQFTLLDAPFTAEEVNMASINKTLIVLIPKKSNASSLKDFRPISLCTTLYKIVVKTIANRIKPIIEDIISPTQSAFLSDRLIFDNILIAQEISHAINHRKSGKIGWVGLKLDMEKAFDRVEWGFLMAILKHLNFPNKIISFIHQCLSSVSTRFSVNGNISNEIFPSRGLRQGDSLSPYLFLLCSEGLAAALCIQEQLGSFNGISIARSAPAILHLLFADDTLLFAKATQSSCNALQAALQLYNQATRQRVNFDAADLVQWASSYLLQYRDAQARKIDDVPAFHLRTTTAVTQAKEGSYQLYTDAAAINDKNSKIGLGAVDMDWNGQVIAGVSLPLSAKVPPIMAEAMALRSGLSWCCSVRFLLSTIFTYSQQLANKIHSHKKELSALANVIVDIKNSLSHFPDVFFAILQEITIPMHIIWQRKL
uniref:Reverse transcriptase domain-containing protein n=1 Tax=Cannabis sativa TaxID=3483 RepID=A0A803QFT6_CANSA